ncbi:MAG: CCA tRNA nucleotidyltransferase [Candidatus Sumerlaeia bacterium]|nr:CCA tRNA nucleotidyltransferase [Candidatus Sumerlaeia bacterium]
MNSIPRSTHSLFRKELLPSPELLEECLAVARKLSAAGHRVWFVGGCVRDALLGRLVKDLDLVTDALPEEISALFGHTAFVGETFGISIVPVQNAKLEVATLRKDGTYTDGRRPDSIQVGTQEEDSRRRDFTINALYFDPVREVVEDFHRGIEDLKLGVLRTVGDPLQRFQEDALRLLRAVRFACRFGFEVSPETRNAMRELASTTKLLSGERVQEEMTRILCGPNPSRGIRLMQHLGLLEYLFPEVLKMDGVRQGRTFHPEGDVLSHTLLACEVEPSRTKVSRWAALLHDVGKPDTFKFEEGKITFYQHEYVGAEIADGILRRLKFSVEERTLITQVVERHMRFMNAHDWSKSTLRRFLAEESIAHDLNVHFADCMACHQLLTAWDLVRRKQLEFQEALANPVPPPLLNGRELIEMGYTPSPVFKKLLHQLQDLQMEGELTTKEEARIFVSRFFEQLGITPARKEETN